MAIFYLVLFCAVGLFNILAAIFNWKWYIDYWMNRKNYATAKRRTNRSVRIAMAVIGIILITFALLDFCGVI